MPRSTNHLLASLPDAAFELLGPHLQAVDLVHEAVLVQAGDPLTHVYFPHSGVISLVVSLAGGEMIEVAMIGRTSIMGAFAALEDRISLNHAIVQLPGTASVLEVERFRKIAEHNTALRDLITRHEHFLFAQAQQSAACNASHGVEARLARYLLQLRDLSRSDTLLLTQELSAQMIGARRNSVSMVANTLQHAGVIRYSRGHIEILDLARLRKAACECYVTVRSHHDRLLRS
ncbi:MAG: Crp/Fnr family transcriptional regulator [Tardiphaga sp.]|nr:Crp/Fnr family transcriptional regulator [Tardiphaga sp.]MDB5504872.1 Crp/Fnr family transcriptional regulator [Tardiphaga sp.]